MTQLQPEVRANNRVAADGTEAIGGMPRKLAAAEHERCAAIVSLLSSVGAIAYGRATLNA